MFPQDVNMFQAEGTILDISLSEVNAKPFLHILLKNQPFNSPTYCNIHFYATESYANYVNSQLSLNDKVYIHSVYVPAYNKNTNVTFNWFKIKKLFISQKYFGLTLQIDEPSKQ